MKDKNTFFRMQNAAGEAYCLSLDDVFEKLKKELNVTGKTTGKISGATMQYMGVDLASENIPCKTVRSLRFMGEVYILEDLGKFELIKLIEMMATTRS